MENVIIAIVILGAAFVLYKVFSTKKGVKNHKPGSVGNQGSGNPDELVNQ